MRSEYDIVIAGGGMVGASLAVALAETGLRIAIVEAVAPGQQQQPSYDDRGLALSLSSRRIFEALGLWHQLESTANPIRRVHVSDRGHFGKVRLDASALGLEALGHVVLARELGSVLRSRINDIDDFDLICPARVTAVHQHPDGTTISLSHDETVSQVECSLLVVADGTQSEIREQLGISSFQTDYQQTAIVSNITPELPHADTAYERFTANGPLAVLPLKDGRCVVVFTVPADRAEHYMDMQGDQFLEEVQDSFGRRMGKLDKLGARQSYPIVQLQVEQQVAGRAVLLGNSAHTVHPNGAQGFNLCLRDVAGLAEQLMLGQRRGLEVGSRIVLDAYLQSRLEDQRAVSQLSHGLARWFYNRQTARTVIRNAGMTLLDLLTPAKSELMRRGMGVHGRQPALVRGPGL